MSTQLLRTLKTLNPIEPLQAPQLHACRIEGSAALGLGARGLGFRVSIYRQAQHRGPWCFFSLRAVAGGFCSRPKARTTKMVGRRKLQKTLGLTYYFQNVRLRPANTATCCYSLRGQIQGLFRQQPRVQLQRNGNSSSTARNRTFMAPRPEPKEHQAHGWVRNTSAEGPSPTQQESDHHITRVCSSRARLIFNEMVIHVHVTGGRRVGRLTPELSWLNLGFPSGFFHVIGPVSKCRGPG